jgi:hypothetical protein
LLPVPLGDEAVKSLADNRQGFVRPYVRLYHEWWKKGRRQ